MDAAEQLPRNTQLIDLISTLVTLPEPIPSEINTKVAGIQMDSRLLQKGDLFIACFGRNHDARDYIDEAIDLGVSAVLAESGGDWQGIELRNNLPIIAVDNLSAKISEIAGKFYSDPSSKLSVIGITGTNGKTSCSQFLAQALTSFSYQSGIIGTLGYGVYGKLQETQLTTPDAVFTQMALAEMVRDNIEPAVMEVSSVGLDQKRVKEVKFDTAIFTNLTRDHLDYHKSMDSYADTKRKLFTSRGLKTAIINLDDTYALSILNSISKNVDVYTYSLNNPIAAVYASELTLNRQGFEADVCTPIGNGRVSSQLIGYFNLSNLFAVIATLVSYLSRRGAIDIHQLCSCVSNLKPVTGRMEIIGDSSDITAVVDYAHTPDGLKSALKALRDHFDGAIWCVFGCGGNRDKGKRPIMGEIAETYANHLIIADDNPRKEEGDDIVQHILSGIGDKSKASVLRDRAKAIDYAIEHAASGDVVLVAGKGHETYQDIGGNKLIFSDANQVRLALQNRTENK
jgi:UDP-N-acetylmuramoyl-L-alanyl-D-glutamate--2,6-diaminopimelate ligase